MVSVNSSDMDREMAGKIADSIATELAKKMYQKLVLFKAMAEISEVESGHIKAKKNEEIDTLFSELLA